MLLGRGIRISGQQICKVVLIQRTFRKFSERRHKAAARIQRKFRYRKGKRILQEIYRRGSSAKIIQRQFRAFILKRKMRKLQLVRLADLIYTKLRKQTISKITSTFKKLSSCIYTRNSFNYIRAKFLFKFFPQIQEYGFIRNQAALRI